MRLVSNGKVLGCESKTGKNGQYFMVLVGGEGWGNKFYSKDFIQPNFGKQVDLVFNFEGDKLYLDTEDLKSKMVD